MAKDVKKKFTISLDIGVREAEQQLKIYQISKCCRGKRKTAGGFI